MPSSGPQSSIAVIVLQLTRVSSEAVLQAMPAASDATIVDDELKVNQLPKPTPVTLARPKSEIEIRLSSSPEINVTSAKR
jgi:hypothetical protein